jgi:hypothetical protein
MDLFCDALNVLEETGGFGHIPGLVLADAQLGHLLHELGVEEALLARLGLTGADFERFKSLLIGKGIIVSGGAQEANIEAEQKKRGDRNHSPHRGNSCDAILPPS